MPRNHSASSFNDVALLNSAAHAPARTGLLYSIQAGRIRGPQQNLQPKNPLWSSSYESKTLFKSNSQLNSQSETTIGWSRTSPAHMPSPPRQTPQPIIPNSCSTNLFPLRPQRIDLPVYLNTPARHPDGLPLSREDRALTLRRLDDLKMLGFACRRAHKSRVEGRTHFSMAILYDNLGQLRDAIREYTNFLKVCKTVGDGQGISLACHCLGVDYFLLAEQLAVQEAHRNPNVTVAGLGARSSSPGRTHSATTTSSPNRFACDPLLASPIRGSFDNPRQEGKNNNVVALMDLADPIYLKKALWFHNKHRESSDSVGRLVAHLNMGLAYRAIGHNANAVKSFEFALKYGVQLNSIEAQVLALGALGLGVELEQAKNDADAVKNVVRKYVAASSKLSGRANAVVNEAIGLERLGGLAVQEGDDETAAELFQKARILAHRVDDRVAATRCGIRMGVAAGEANMHAHKQEVLRAATANAEHNRINYR